MATTSDATPAPTDNLEQTDGQITGDPRAYAQWVIVVLVNIGNTDMKLDNLRVEWGKLHENGNKDVEENPDKYNGSVIKPGSSLQFSACGRANSPSGTTGRFSLFDTRDNSEIRSFYWDCPWGSSTNTWQVQGSNTRWMVESHGANLVSGALGTITVQVLNRA
ncbi:pleurotolysin A [Cytidiella melzeri]|nr:pleurotolysin A [Cytidiella melzeri]